MADPPSNDKPGGQGLPPRSGLPRPGGAPPGPGQRRPLGPPGGAKRTLLGGSMAAALGQAPPVHRGPGPIPPAEVPPAPPSDQVPTLEPPPSSDAPPRTLAFEAVPVRQPPPKPDYRGTLAFGALPEPRPESDLPVPSVRSEHDDDDEVARTLAFEALPDAQQPTPPPEEDEDGVRTLAFEALPDADAGPHTSRMPGVAAPAPAIPPARGVSAPATSKGKFSATLAFEASPEAQAIADDLQRKVAPSPQPPREATGGQPQDLSRTVAYVDEPNEPLASQPGAAGPRRASRRGGIGSTIAFGESSEVLRKELDRMQQVERQAQQQAQQQGAPKRTTPRAFPAVGHAAEPASAGGPPRRPTPPAFGAVVAPAAEPAGPRQAHRKSPLSATIGFGPDQSIQREIAAAAARAEAAKQSPEIAAQQQASKGLAATMAFEAPTELVEAARADAERRGAEARSELASEAAEQIGDLRKTMAYLPAEERAPVEESARLTMAFGATGAAVAPPPAPTAATPPRTTAFAAVPAAGASPPHRTGVALQATMAFEVPEESVRADGDAVVVGPSSAPSPATRAPLAPAKPHLPSLVGPRASPPMHTPPPSARPQPFRQKTMLGGMGSSGSPGHEQPPAAPAAPQAAWPAQPPAAAVGGHPVPPAEPAHRAGAASGFATTVGLGGPNPGSAPPPPPAPFAAQPAPPPAPFAAPLPAPFAAPPPAPYAAPPSPLGAPATGEPPPFYNPSAVAANPPAAQGYPLAPPMQGAVLAQPLAAPSRSKPPFVAIIVAVSVLLGVVIGLLFWLL